jgi:hypothetical protein
MHFENENGRAWWFRRMWWFDSISAHASIDPINGLSIVKLSLRVWRIWWFRINSTNGCARSIGRDKILLFEIGYLFYNLTVYNGLVKYLERAHDRYGSWKRYIVEERK